MQYHCKLDTLLLSHSRSLTFFSVLSVLRNLTKIFRSAGKKVEPSGKIRTCYVNRKLSSPFYHRIKMFETISGLIYMQINDNSSFSLTNREKRGNHTFSSKICDNFVSHLLIVKNRKIKLLKSSAPLQICPATPVFFVAQLRYVAELLATSEHLSLYAMVVYSVWCTPLKPYSMYDVLCGCTHRVHILVEMKQGQSAHSAGVYTATLLVRVNVMRGGGRAPPHLHQPGPILPSSLNVRQKHCCQIPPGLLGQFSQKNSAAGENIRPQAGHHPKSSEKVQ